MVSQLQQAPSSNAPKHGSSERVFVIDDDPKIGDRLKERLSARGYSVAVSQSRRHALEKMRDVSPHYILLDVMLGDGLGYDVARKVRRDSLLYRVPILFQSIANDEMDIAHALEQGGDSYITKPYSESDLLTRLDDMRHLRNSIESRCPITDFNTLSALRREVDHLLFRGEEFAVLYIFMKGLDNLRHARDPNVIKRVAFITGKCIKHTTKIYGFYETFPCHLGGGYFMVKTTLDDYRRFRKLVREDFQTRAEELAGAGVQSHLVDSSPDCRDHSHYNLLVGSTNTQRTKFRCATQMFETLHQVEKVGRQKSQRINEAARRRDGHNHWVD